LNWEVVFYSLPSGKQPVLAWLTEQAPAEADFLSTDPTS